MFLSFAQRGSELTEAIDDPECDSEKLTKTYKQFYLINRALSQSRTIYKQHIRPLMSEDRQYSLLDIGYGAGDIALSYKHWAQADGLSLKISGVDTSARALAFVDQYHAGSGIDFRHLSSAELVERGDKFDFVISNHILHHLNEEQLASVLNDANILASRAAIFNDLERSALAYYLFKFIAPLIFHRSFIVPDGLISIRRSYTLSEIAQKISHPWTAKTLFPFRLLLIREGEGS